MASKSRNYKMLIGIDPGKSGGIAHMLYDRDTQHGLKVTAINMPETITDFDQYIKYLVNETKNTGHIVLVEKIQMFASSAQNPGMVIRMQRLLANYNKMLSALEIAGIRFQEVTPMQWQRHYSKKVPEDRTKRKNFFKQIAAQRFKMIKPTLNVSDALCILDYLRIQCNLNPKLTECPTPTNLL